MHANAMRMTLISSALFVLVTALFFFLFCGRRQTPQGSCAFWGFRPVSSGGSGMAQASS